MLSITIKSLLQFLFIITRIFAVTFDHCASINSANLDETRYSNPNICNENLKWCFMFCEQGYEPNHKITQCKATPANDFKCIKYKSIIKPDEDGKFVDPATSTTITDFEHVPNDAIPTPTQVTTLIKCHNVPLNIKTPKYISNDDYYCNKPDYVRSYVSYRCDSEIEEENICVKARDCEFREKIFHSGDFIEGHECPNGDSKGKYLCHMGGKIKLPCGKPCKRLEMAFGKDLIELKETSHLSYGDFNCPESYFAYPRSINGKPWEGRAFCKNGLYTESPTCFKHVCNLQLMMNTDPTVIFHQNCYNLSPGTSCHYSCIDNYVRIDDAKLICSPHGLLNEPLCIEGCEPMVNEIMSYEKNVVGGKVFITCLNCRVPLWNNLLCQRDGTLEKPALCVEECERNIHYRFEENAIVEIDFPCNSGICNYYCNEDYVAHGDHKNNFGPKFGTFRCDHNVYQHDLCRKSEWIVNVETAEKRTDIDLLYNCLAYPIKKCNYYCSKQETPHTQDIEFGHEHVGQTSVEQCKLKQPILCI